MTDEDGMGIVEDVESAAKEHLAAKPKTCFICETNRAEFCIKGAPEDCYCKECAQDAFGDVSYLEKL